MARRPAQLLALFGFLAIGGALVYAFASSAETNSVAVCNQATQVNTVCTSQNTLTLATSSGPGWWHTAGGQIEDAAGNPVFLRGVDDGRMTQTTPGTLGDTEYSNLSSWGFNFIRLAISWANLEPAAPSGSGTALSHTWSSSYLSAIDSAVQDAQTNHLRLVLDFHQVDWSPKFNGTGFPSWLFPSSTVTEGQAKCEFMTNTIESGVPESQQAGLIAAEQMIASRYKSNPTVVGIDMFNEPQSCNYNGAQTFSVPAGGTPYDDFYHNAATALSQTNPNLLLIYEDDAYQPYLKIGFALARALDVPNGVYSTHTYPDSWPNGNDGTTCSEPASTTTGQQVYQNHLNRAASWQQPLYIGEFDGFHLARNGCTPLSSASTDLLSLMSSAKSDHVNWSLWEYNRTGESLLDSTGQPKQPLLSDLQTGIDAATSGTTPTAAQSGSVTLCQAGSGTLNAWNSVALNVAVPSGTAASVKVATASGSCATPTAQTTFSAPITIADASTGGAGAHDLSGLNLANSKLLIMEVDLGGTGSSSPTVNSVSVTDTPQSNNPPSVPTNLAGTPGLTTVALSWAASTDDTDAQNLLTYRVSRGGVQIGQTSPGVTTYNDSGLSEATAYTYTVVACDTQSSCSAPSAVLSVTTLTDTTRPTVPTNLTTSISGTTATLTWKASTDPDNTAAQLSYQVFRNNVLLGTTQAGVTKYIDSGLAQRTSYTYTVAACDLAGNCSAKSAGLTLKTGAVRTQKH